MCPCTKMCRKYSPRDSQVQSNCTDTCIVNSIKDSEMIEAANGSYRDKMNDSVMNLEDSPIVLNEKDNCVMLK